MADQTEIVRRGDLYQLYNHPTSDEVSPLLIAPTDAAWDQMPPRLTEMEAPIVVGVNLIVAGKPFIRGNKPLGKGGYYTVYRALDPENNYGPVIIRSGLQGEKHITTDPRAWEVCSDLPFHPEVVVTELKHNTPTIVYREKVDADDPAWKIVDITETTVENALRLAYISLEAAKVWHQKGFAFIDWQDDEMVRLDEGGRIAGWRVIDFSPRIVLPDELRPGSDFWSALTRIELSSDPSVIDLHEKLRTLDERLKEAENGVAIQKTKLESLLSTDITSELIQPRADAIFKAEEQKFMQGRNIFQRVFNTRFKKTAADFMDRAKAELEREKANDIARGHRLIEVNTGLTESIPKDKKWEIEMFNIRSKVVSSWPGDKYDEKLAEITTYTDETDAALVEQTLNRENIRRCMYLVGLTNTLNVDAGSLPTGLWRRVRQGSGFYITQHAYQDRDENNNMGIRFFRHRIRPILMKMQRDGINIKPYEEDAKWTFENKTGVAGLLSMGDMLDSISQRAVGRTFEVEPAEGALMVH